MSIYLQINEINNLIDNHENRLNNLEVGTINVASASFTYLTASNFSASAGFASLTRLTASNFSASAGLANLTRLTASNFNGTDILVTRLTASNINVNNATINSSLICSGNILFRDGYGIDFSQTSDGSAMTSEFLDDYEEGTWTPAYGSSGGGTATYNVGYQTGFYTKIGRVVFLQGAITTATTGTLAAGNIKITGFPFTIKSSNYSTLNIATFANFATNIYNVTIFATGDSNELQLFKVDTAGISNERLTRSDLENGTLKNDLVFSGFYLTDS